MKLLRKVGATSEIWQVFVRDSSSTTGGGLTGLVFNTASLTAYYHRDTDTTATAISLVTMTVGTFTSSGFKEIDATNMPGWYQFCPPNAAIASGAKSCAFHLKGATNMAPLPIEVDLDAQVDVTFWNGTVVATPATAGIPDVNAKNINNIATTSVTVVSANVGTTQPINFTGTAGSALAKSDMVDIAGAAVSTSTAQLGVNIVNVAGSASVGAAGYVAIDMAQALSATPTANTVGESLFLADILGGRFGTAQAGGASTITLDASASAVDGRYVGYGCFLYGGTGGGVRGVGQERTIVAYNGTTKVATLAQAWGTNPDNTSKFMLIVHPWANVGIWNGTVVSTPATAGIPDVNAKNWGNSAVTGMPMPTYTQPTGFLTATFPSGTIANTTNITTAAGCAVSSIGNDVITAASVAADAGVEIGTAVWATTTRILTAGTNIALAKGTGVTGFNDITVAAILTTQMTESYTTGAFTLAQAMYEIAQVVGQFSIVSTTLTMQQRDGTTPAGTFTLDSATAPTSRTRAS